MTKGRFSGGTSDKSLSIYVSKSSSKGMGSSFTVLWNHDRVAIAKRHGLLGQPIPFLFGGPHTSQPSFCRAGVQGGDVVYPVQVKSGVVHLLARVVVREIVPVETFVHERTDLYPPEKRGRWMGETLDIAIQSQPWLRALNWTCSDHVLKPEKSSPLTVEVTLPVHALERLSFRSKKTLRPIEGVEDGRLTTITGLQGVYRLSEKSAEDFWLAAEGGP